MNFPNVFQAVYVANETVIHQNQNMLARGIGEKFVAFKEAVVLIDM